MWRIFVKWTKSEPWTIWPAAPFGDSTEAWEVTAEMFRVFYRGVDYYALMVSREESDYLTAAPWPTGSLDQ